jgi:hypothetical protein
VQSAWSEVRLGRRAGRIEKSPWQKREVGDAAGAALLAPVLPNMSGVRACFFHFYPDYPGLARWGCRSSLFLFSAKASKGKLSYEGQAASAGAKSIALSALLRMWKVRVAAGTGGEFSFSVTGVCPC